jgi:SAM-dependent methyltransferase
MTDQSRPRQAEIWESEAENWIAWARAPHHDAYWDYAPFFFAEIVPGPGRRTLEIGCGEGRVTRDLKRLGHRVVSVDRSPALIRAAKDADPHGRYLLADAARLPFADGSFDLAVAYNSLMDMEEMTTPVRDIARVLRSNGRFCICVTHPVGDAGHFDRRAADAPFVIEGNYLKSGSFDETFERAGLIMRFRGLTHPIEAYARALEDAGLLIDRLREPAQRDAAVASDPAEARWQRLPMFLFIRAVRGR